MKKFLSLAASLGAVATLCMGSSGCDDAKVASENLTKAADNFEIARRIVFYNGITDAYMLEVRGYCSIDNGQTANSLAVTCKTPTGYKKHLLGRSNNVTYFVEQLADAQVSVDFYRVTFKPSVIVPDIDIRGPGLDRDTKALPSTKPIK